MVISLFDRVVNTAQKGKMQVTSIFSFSYSVFQSFLFLGLSKVLRVSPFSNKPWLLCVCNTSLLKTLWNNQKLLIMRTFSFCHSVFYPFKKKLFAIFTKFAIVICDFFQFGRVKNLLFVTKLNRQIGVYCISLTHYSSQVTRRLSRDNLSNPHDLDL